MTGESYQIKPQGSIVSRGGDRVRYAEKILTEAALPGMLMTCNSNDYKAKKAAVSTHPFGWAAYEHCDCKTRPATYETAYASGDVVPILYGADFDIYAIATGSTDASTTINAGDLLTSNDDGTLKVYSPNGTVASTTATNPYPPVARALETITIAQQATTPKTARIMVQSLI